MTAINKLLKEPILQFLFLGTLLFFITAYIQKRSNRMELEVVVDNALVNMMVVKYQSQNGNLPTKQQLDAIIENHIREEILFREGKKMGLDKDDEIIRRRIVQKYDFLQTDLTPLADPTDEQLLEFYTSHPELFQQDATVNFSHIFFSTDKGSDSMAVHKARVVLAEIKRGNLQRAPEKGDRFALQYDYTEQPALDIRQNFGDKPLVDSLFKAPLKTWTGPVQSGYGWHLIYIVKRVSANTIPYASIAEDVKTKYQDAAKATQNTKAFDRLREKYAIKRAYLETK